MPRRTSPGRIAAMLGAAALVGGLAPLAEAGSWSHTGRAGRTWSGSTSHYNNGGGNVGGTASVTRPDGQTATYTYNRSVSGGAVSSTGTATGYNGGTATRSTTRTPGEGGSETVTGPNGGTASAQYTRPQ